MKDRFVLSVAIGLIVGLLAGVEMHAADAVRRTGGGEPLPAPVIDQGIPVFVKRDGRFLFDRNAAPEADKPLIFRDDDLPSLDSLMEATDGRGTAALGSAGQAVAPAAQAQRAAVSDPAIVKSVRDEEMVPLDEDALSRLRLFNRETENSWAGRAVAARVEQPIVGRSVPPRTFGASGAAVAENPAIATGVPAVPAQRKKIEKAVLDEEFVVIEEDEPQPGPTKAATVPTEEEIVTAPPLPGEKKTLILFKGQSFVLNLSGVVSKVFISRPNVIKVEYDTPTDLIVSAVGAGETVMQVTLQDQTRINYLTEVREDVTPLREFIRKHYPMEDAVRVDAYKSQIFVSGKVTSEVAKQGIAQIAESMFPGQIRDISSVYLPQERPVRQIQCQSYLVEFHDIPSENWDSQFFHMERGTQTRAPWLFFSNYQQNFEMDQGGVITVPAGATDISRHFMQNYLMNEGPFRQSPVPLLGWTSTTAIPGSIGGINPAARGRFMIVDPNTRTGLMIEAFEQQRIARTISRPTLVMDDGAKATFHAGEEIPYVTVADAPPTFKKVGTTVEGEAHLVQEDIIKMYIKVSYDQRGDRFNQQSGEYYSIRTRNIETTVTIKNDTCFALGGLLFHYEAEVKEKVPYLSDIPLLGLLFTSTSTEKENRELVLFMRPKLVKPQAPGWDVHEHIAKILNQKTLYEQTTPFTRLTQLLEIEEITQDEPRRPFKYRKDSDGYMGQPLAGAGAVGSERPLDIHVEGNETEIAPPGGN